jgi:hypothetical protein
MEIAYGRSRKYSFLRSEGNEKLCHPVSVSLSPLAVTFVALRFCFVCTRERGENINVNVVMNVISKGLMVATGCALCVMEF